MEYPQKAYYSPMAQFHYVFSSRSVESCIHPTMKEAVYINMLKFNTRGILLPGIHVVPWSEFVSLYSFSPRRQHLFNGMERAFIHFRNAGCTQIYIDGSFVTRKIEPNDYDACWDMAGVNFSLLDPMFHRDLRMGTKKHKLVYYGEFYPAPTIEGGSGLTFLDFFQTDRETGNRKGIILIELEGVK